MAARPGRRVGLTLAALALAGCAVAGPLPSPPGPVPPPTVAGADGAPLALAEWPAEAPRAVILGVHGYGDHGSSTFANAAAFWAAGGISVYAYDQRGFGRNPSFGYWPGPEALAADLVAVSRELRARHPCLPLVVVGHSMGGGVALAAAAEGLEADGLVLAAPAIWGGAYLNPLQRALSWVVAAAVPDRRFTGEGIVKIQASDNLEALRAMARDPHYLRPPSAREIMGLVRVMDLAEAAAPNVTVPALLLLGEKDQIVPNGAAEQVFARLTGSRQEIVYPEGWHLLFRDLQAARVWRDVADWTSGVRHQDPACPAPSG